MVATVPDQTGVGDIETEGKETIVGLALWYRLGPEGQYRIKRELGIWNWLSYSLLRLTSRVQVWLENFVRPNRLHNPLKADVCDRSMERHWDEIWTPGTQRAESWLLGTLAVDPHYQGMGIGARLVEEGCRVADKEGVSASLVSVEGLEDFYVNKCGFSERVIKLGGEKGTELEDYDGGWVLFREKKKLL
jgi:GNAT superfamily N-acetyltransferase